MNDREELGQILDRWGINDDPDYGLPQEILAWHTSKLNEAQISLVKGLIYSAQNDETFGLEDLELVLADLQSGEQE